MGILKIIAALINLAFGLYSFFQPEPIARASKWTLDNARGRAELRVAVGGFFIGLGLAALILNNHTVYQLLGAGWLGGFAARIGTLALENPKGLIDPSYLALGILELSMGIILVI